MVKFAVYLKTKEGKQNDFLAAMDDFLPTVKKEKGTVQYDICQSDDDPTSFVIFEVYKSKAANEAHTDSPEFKAFFGRISPLMAFPPVMHPVKESAK